MEALTMIFWMLVINGTVCIAFTWLFSERWSEIFGIGGVLTIGMTLFTSVFAQVFVSFVIFLIAAAVLCLFTTAVIGLVKETRKKETV